MDFNIKIFWKSNINPFEITLRFICINIFEISQNPKENKRLSSSIVHLNKCLKMVKDESIYKPVIPFRETKLTGFINQILKE